MSLQNATVFVQRLSQDQDLSERVTSKDAAVRLGQELDLTFTVAELEQAARTFTGDMSDDQLKELSAGLMKCC